GESRACQIIQAHPHCHNVPAEAPGAQVHPGHSIETLDLLQLDQRRLPVVLLAELRREGADLPVIAVTGDAPASFGHRLRQGMELCPRGRRDIDSGYACHDITHAGFRELLVAPRSATIAATMSARAAMRITNAEALRMEYRLVAAILSGACAILPWM